MTFEKPKKLTCDCDENAFFVHNVSNGEYIYTCARSTLEWDSKKKKWYNDEKSKFKPCKYKYVYTPECNKNLTFPPIVKKKKYIHVPNYSDKIGYIPQKVKYFKTNKRTLHFQEIEMQCKKFYIPTFQEWEFKHPEGDLGDYCEYLLYFCNTVKSYNDIRKHYKILISEEQVKIDILQNIIDVLTNKVDIFNKKEEETNENFKIYIEKVNKVSKKYHEPPPPVKVSKEGRKIPRIRKKGEKPKEIPEEVQNGPLHDAWLKSKNEKLEAYDNFYNTFDEFIDEYQFDKIKKRDSSNIVLAYIVNIRKELEKVIDQVKCEKRTREKKLNFCTVIRKEIYTKRQEKYKWLKEEITQKLENLEL